MQIQGRIPISISPVFFVTAALIGYLSTESLLGALLWMGVIFFSILIHELGHALVAYFIGLRPRIELNAFGGITHHGGESLSRARQLLIVLGGPFFSLLLFLASYLLFHVLTPQNAFIFEVLYVVQWVNLVWTVFNLFPVLPLDGGQVLRLILEMIFKRNGTRYALFCSMAFAISLGLLFFFWTYYIVGLFFFFFAYQNYESRR